MLQQRPARLKEAAENFDNVFDASTIMVAEGRARQRFRDSSLGQLFVVGCRQALGITMPDSFANFTAALVSVVAAIRQAVFGITGGHTSLLPELRWDIVHGSASRCGGPGAWRL